jgi:cytochrome c oxidase assembly factor CtaG
VAAPAVLALAALAAVLFLQAFVRLRRRGRSDHASYGRAVLFFLGLALLVLPVVSPLDVIGEQYLLSGHMLQHVLIGDAAAALLVVSLRGPLLFFLLPGPALVPLARSRPLRAVVRFLARPLVALVVWAAVIAFWHVPAFYDAALTNELVHDLEHASFVLAGLLVWFQLVDPVRRRALSRGARLALATAVFAAGQVLTTILLFSPEPPYDAYAMQEERLFGISPLTDQRLAGAVMMVEQTLTLGTCAAFLVLAAERVARQSPEPPALAPGPRG